MDCFLRLKRSYTKITSQVWLRLSIRVPTHKWYHRISPRTKLSVNAIQGRMIWQHSLVIKTRKHIVDKLQVGTKINWGLPRRGPRREWIRAQWTPSMQDFKLESILISHVHLRRKRGNFWAIRKNINNFKESKYSSILKAKKLGNRYSNHLGKVSSNLMQSHQRGHNSDN